MHRLIRAMAVATATIILAGLAATSATAGGRDHPERDDLVVIAHRGASGYRPEHTLAAYRLAIQQCADAIEPDLVTTSDGVLVDRHEPEISGTTDVADHPEFASRKTTKVLDGNPVTGWFTEDFTLAELRTLRAIERLPDLRPDNTAYDGRYQVPTFAEVLKLATSSRTCSGKRVAVIPEIKHSTFFRQQGFDLEPQVVAMLNRFGLHSRRDPVVIQSFEITNLQRLNRMTSVRLVQLVDCQGSPYDQVVAGNDVSYADMVTATGLRRVSRYADQVGLCKNLMIPRKADNTLGRPTSVIRDSHRAGLTVVGWTFRRENSFLPADFQHGTDPAGIGDLVGEIRVFLRAGMDAFFTDNPDLGVQAVRRR
ncbi:glycerophosphodiester phosphodiesterase [Micropruina sonneratiae]|uniref:glycerophosphodiester phosphodiesterase n=1 Tax=Micropruina sonneratiae TaxID=2986940 RepID=UPI002227DE33|nr:glycerophosphodiester phosphodiesterase [Micropruina sp. KQZ13P-5]MCW3158507.1 glycerophosphodiester phosphodiesterase [Micropruina sp. KQZ13P-5]